MRRASCGDHHFLTKPCAPNCVYYITHQLLLRSVSVSTDTILREIRPAVNSSRHSKPQSAYTKHTHDVITAHKFVGTHPIWDGTGSIKDTKDVTKIDAIAPTFHVYLVFNTSVLF